MPSNLFNFKIIEDCWVWQGCLRDGYGKSWYNNRSLGSHKVIYELLVGPVPKGYQLDHLCRNRACVNPEHLEPVTCRENLLRGQTKMAANLAKTSCLRGHPYTEENTYNRKDRIGRNCKRCRYELAIKRKQRHQIA